MPEAADPQAPGWFIAYIVADSVASDVVIPAAVVATVNERDNLHLAYAAVAGHQRAVRRAPGRYLVSALKSPLLGKDLLSTAINKLTESVGDDRQRWYKLLHRGPDSSFLLA